MRIYLICKVAADPIIRPPVLFDIVKCLKDILDGLSCHMAPIHPLDGDSGVLTDTLPEECLAFLIGTLDGIGLSLAIHLILVIPYSFGLVIIIDNLMTRLRLVESTCDNSHISQTVNLKLLYI